MKLRDSLHLLPERTKQVILLVLDSLLIPLCLFLAVAIHLDTEAAFELAQTSWSICLLLMLAGAAGSSLLGIQRHRLNAYETNAMAKTAGFSLLVTLCLAALTRLGQIAVDPGLFIVFGMLFFLSSAGIRILTREVLIHLRRMGQPVSRVVIYGAGLTGVQLASALKNEEAIVTVAFIDDNKSLEGQTAAGIPVFHGANLEAVIERTRPNRIVIAMPSADRAIVARLERRLTKTGITVQVLPSFAQIVGEELLTQQLLPPAPGTFLGRENLHEETNLDRDHYNGRSVLISGGGGSIGSELTRQVLASRPKKVVLLEMSEHALYLIVKELNEQATENGIRLVPVLGDASDTGLVQHLLELHEVDVVLHAAAYKHVPIVEESAIQGFRNNISATLTLALQAQKAGVSRFVLLSTDKAVRPTGIMGASKRMAELIVQDIATRAPGTVFSIVRFGNVLGSSGSVVPLFQEQVSQGGPVTLTHRDVTRYFMTVREAAQLVLTAGTFSSKGGVFVLDMGKPRKIYQLARQVIEASGYTVLDEDHPNGDIEILEIGLRPGEKMHEELLISGTRETTEHSKIYRAKEDSLSEIEMARAIRDFQDAFDRFDEGALRKAIETWVEGFSPANRFLEAVDTSAG